MAERIFAAIQAERSRSTLNQHKRRACPTCEGLDAAVHPLAIGAVVTVLHYRDRSLVAEGIATILRPADEPDIYFVKFRGEARIQKRLIFAEYQRDPARALHVINRHLASARRLLSTSPEPPTPGERL